MQVPEQLCGMRHPLLCKSPVSVRDTHIILCLPCCQLCVGILADLCPLRRYASS